MAVICDNLNFNSQYLFAKENLEISLQLYRMLILYNITSGMLMGIQQVQRCQHIFEQLCAIRYLDGK